MYKNWIQENNTSILLKISEDDCVKFNTKTNIVRYHEKKFSDDTRTAEEKSKVWKEFFEFNIHPEAPELMIWAKVKTESDEQGSLHFGHFYLADIKI